MNYCNRFHSNRTGTDHGDFFLRTASSDECGVDARGNYKSIIVICMLR